MAEDLATLQERFNRVQTECEEAQKNFNRLTRETEFARDIGKTLLSNSFFSKFIYQNPMNTDRLQFPIRVIIGSQHHNETTREITVSSDMKWVDAAVGGFRCLPLFTTTGALRRFMADRPPTGFSSYAFNCDAGKLLEILEAVKPAGIVIDPSDETRPDDILDTRIIAAGLKSQL